jgi:pyruvate,orthophosphate dikinase
VGSEDTVATTVATRLVYPFDADMRSPAILGGKGSSLARMAALGLPIPPGFTIATAAWAQHRDPGAGISAALAEEIDAAIAGLEQSTGRSFDHPSRPLLVSVRSGAAVSMPGMMETILNLGLSDAVVEGLAGTIDARFAWDIYASLLDAYATVVRGVSRAQLDQFPGVHGDCGRERAAALKAAMAASGRPFPHRARDQLNDAIAAVWRSWDSPPARRYRQYRGISETLGTAITVQVMVFGNLDRRSGTGVAFTRDPSTGRPGIYGDFIRQAQGQDVVAGIRRPEPIGSAKHDIPGPLAELQEALGVLETSYRDMCDVEFTVESDRLWILQARVGERSGAAAVRIATDMVDEGLIDIETALRRIPLSALEELQAPVAARNGGIEIVARGVPASPGAAIGEAVFDVDRAEDLADEGRDVILIRAETSPKDVAGMIAASGIVTALGGRASHGAVVARSIGVPAVCGVEGLRIDADGGSARLPGGVCVREGDTVTIDGAAGSIMLGAVRLVPPQPDEHLSRLLSWCDERARTPVVLDPPAGYVRVGSVEEVETAGDLVLVDVPWEGPDSAAAFAAVCAALVARDPSPRLALVVPEKLRGGDLRPPRARWEAIVGTPGTLWAARLLSARLERQA